MYSVKISIARFGTHVITMGTTGYGEIQTRHIKDGGNEEAEGHREAVSGDNVSHQREKSLEFFAMTCLCTSPETGMLCYHAPWQKNEVPGLARKE